MAFVNLLTWGLRFFKSLKDFRVLLLVFSMDLDKFGFLLAIGILSFGG
jgi:hypothetical protein